MHVHIDTYIWRQHSTCELSFIDKHSMFSGSKVSNQPVEILFQKLYEHMLIKIKNGYNQYGFIFIASLSFSINF